MKKKLLYLTCLSTPLLATDYTFVDLNAPWHFGAEFSMKDKGHPWHFEGDFYTIGDAKVTTSGKAKDSKITNSTAYAALYYSHFLGNDNALSWQLGYSYLRFKWDENPRFSQDQFHYGLASLAWVSNSMENWRWVVSTGVNADLEWLDQFNKSAVYYGFVWGRYAYALTVGIHIGFFGYAGIGTGYMLPVLGLDWQGGKWKFTAVLPLDLSVDYYFTSHFFTSLGFTTFGGPYRYPRRFRGGEQKYHDGIFKYYSKGMDLSFTYDYDTFIKICAGGGWNFGGWVLIENSHGNHGKYYKYDGAPYALVEIAGTF